MFLVVCANVHAMPSTDTDVCLHVIKHKSIRKWAKYVYVYVHTEIYMQLYTTANVLDEM